jgi:3-oxoacyl-(acyl-carrier-protein) synthase
MDTDRNLLFGVVAFQKGAADADRLVGSAAEPARTLMNLGSVLSDQARIDEAESDLVRAIGINTAIAAANPLDVWSFAKSMRAEAVRTRLSSQRGPSQSPVCAGSSRCRARLERPRGSQRSRLRRPVSHGAPT